MSLVHISNIVLSETVAYIVNTTREYGNNAYSPQTLYKTISSHNLISIKKFAKQACSSKARADLKPNYSL